MITTINQLSSFITGTPESTLKEYLHPIIDTTAIYKINNAKRFSAFISQISYESGGFRHTEENLNYSAERLMQVFRTHFSSLAEAKEYEHHPQDIANKVYANRYGNGNEQSGDGWRFRGRSPIMVTFKDNYKHYGDLISEDLINNPGLLTEPEYGVLVSGAYWDSKDLNDLADKEDIEGITRKINGGLNGYKERLSLYRKALKIFS